jgi:hypothetical protein
VVIVHWLLVALLAGGFYCVTSLRRRRERIAAGPLLLRVSGRPMSQSRRQVISWLLLCAVVLDGVVMSAFVLPAAAAAFLPPFLDRPFAFLGTPIYVLIGQGLLWRYCLDHWLTNVYSVEFCENGVLTYGKYFPWQNATRIVWSPAQPANLVIAAGGYVHEVTIEPAAHAAVSELLASRAARTRST